MRAISKIYQAESNMSMLGREQPEFSSINGPVSVRSEVFQMTIVFPGPLKTCKIMAFMAVTRGLVSLVL